MFVKASRQLARSLQPRLLNELGFPKTFARSLQISEVVNCMKDLFDFSREHKLGPIDGASCPAEEDFFNRLLETGVTESCSDYVSPSQMKDDKPTIKSTMKNILRNISCSINYTCHADDELAATLLVILLEDEHSRQLQKTAIDLQMEVKNFQVAIGELHLKHKLLADKVQNHRDVDAKNKAEHKHLAELEESNCKLAALKEQRDTAQGKPFPFQTSENNHVGGDRVRDKQKELQDLECTLKEMMELISSRLVDVRRLHEERIEILKKLATF